MFSLRQGCRLVRKLRCTCVIQTSWFPCLSVFSVILLMGFMSCRKEPLPPTPEDPELFAACVIPGTSQSLDIMTLNAGGFPRDGYTSIVAVASLIKAIDPDAVALQEIKTESDFKRLVRLMDGWTGYFNPANEGEWNLAFLFKSAETEVYPSSAMLLFTGDSWSFPRAPYEIRLKHKPAGQDLYLINLHLKCCSGTDNENSRKSASQKLKEYLDASRPGSRVVVLGDFNDDIISAAESENPFLNFVNAPAGYHFADMPVAKGSALWWSYPSYPSHIDHILITDELFGSLDTTYVIKAGPCYPDYETKISDHRPVAVRLQLK